MVTGRAPSDPNDGPGPDGHHTVTGECFACLVGVATGPESHGDRCSSRRPLLAGVDLVVPGCPCPSHRNHWSPCSCNCDHGDPGGR